MYREPEWENAWGNLIRGFYILLGLVFLPALFCLFFLDPRIEYNKWMRLPTLLPNSILFVIALSALAVLCLLAGRIGKIKLTARGNIVFHIALIVVFVLLYFLNEWIARETIYQIGNDIGKVAEAGINTANGNPLYDEAYFSIYPNNISITYILKNLYTIAMNMRNYPYPPDFFWIQMNCALISLGGLMGCLTVKKLTKEIVPTAAYFLLYLGLVGLTPWKLAPYTDTYGFAFPITALYFYLCYREVRKEAIKYLCLALALANVAVGGFIKPNIYLLFIAVFLTEFIYFLQDWKQKWKYLLCEALLIAGFIASKGIIMERAIGEVGLEYNKELSASWQYYFCLGQNEEYTGAYFGEDERILKEFQDSSLERNRMLWERGIARVKEKGLGGNLFFWLKKLIMVFNDGTFDWHKTGGVQDGRSMYPVDLAKNDHVTQFLRDVFWQRMPYTGRYNTFCQLVWIFCLTGVPGFCFLQGQKRKDWLILAISCLGILFYQMLFEASARYLFAFLPLFSVISIGGMWQYIEWLAGWPEKRKRGV